VQGAILAGKCEAGTGEVVALNPNSVGREKAAPSGSNSDKDAAGGFGHGAVVVET